MSAVPYTFQNRVVKIPLRELDLNFTYVCQLVDNLPSAPVLSVNTKTGHVTLFASDVGADPAGAGDAAAFASMNAHLAASDPHPQYLTVAEGNSFYELVGTASGIMAAHLADPNPHPQYLTAASGGGLYDPLGSAADSMSAHLAALDPHPQYLTASDISGSFDPAGTAAATMEAHEAAPDPHPQYLTPAEAGGLYEPAGTMAAHLAAADPHAQYALKSGTLAQFAPTTSAELAALISDETGSGALVFANAPTLVNPDVGTQAPGNNSALAASTAFVTAAVAAGGGGGAGTFVLKAGDTMTGPLGIGAAPLYPLHVVATGQSVASFNSTNTSSSFIRFGDGTAERGYVGSGASVLTGMVATDFGITGAPGARLVFGANNAEAFRVATDLRVQIGNTDKTNAKLNVTNGISNYATGSDGADSNKGIYSFNSATTFAGFGLQLNAANNFSIFVGNTSTNWIERLRLTKTGHVETSGQLRAGGWYDGSTVGAYNGLAVEIGVSGTDGYLCSYNRGASTYGSLNIHTSIVNIAPGGTNLIYINTVGMSIGTSSITAKLNISGAAVNSSPSNISGMVSNSLLFRGNNSGAGGYAGLTYESGGGGGAAVLFSRDASYGTQIRFYTNSAASGGALTERMSLDGSGNLALTGSLSVSDPASLAAAMFNNMNRAHATYSDANALGFGIYYLQGATNGPQAAPSQHYIIGMGLGNEYPTQYGMQFAFPRLSSGGTATPYLFYRQREGTAWGGWGKAAAGYADTAGSAGSAGAVTNHSGRTDNTHYPALWSPAGGGGAQPTYSCAAVTINSSEGSIKANEVYSNNWLRTSGANGWYNSLYAGGMYMTDTTYVRTYNGKGLNAPFMMIESNTGSLVFRHRLVTSSVVKFGAIYFSAYRDVSDPSYVGGIWCEGNSPIGNYGDLVFGATSNASSSAPPEGMRLNSGGSLSVVGAITLGNYFYRTAHHTGCLVGGYNNIGANSTNSNPIYCIGSAYLPASTTLGNMYGIGYSNVASGFAPAGSTDWGMYVAGAGGARVWLGGNDGKVICAGDVVAYASDKRLKTNVKNIANALFKVESINGVEFDWVDDIASYGFSPSAMHETGVIAQEIQLAVPDAVVVAPFNTEATRLLGIDNHYLTVKKEKLIPLLIEAVKELSSQNKDLSRRLKVLEGDFR